MKFASKSEFEKCTAEQWDSLWQLVENYQTHELDKKHVRQVLAHLYAWHLLLLDWHRIGQTGMPDLPAPGFNWRQTPALNAKLDSRYGKLSLSSIRRRLKLSHGRVMNMVANLSDRQFLQPGQFDWTGKHALASYVVPNTFSHYRWAIKKLKKIRSGN